MDYNRFRVQYWTRMILILLTTGIIAIWIQKTSLNIMPIFLAGILIIQIVTLLHRMEKPQRDMKRFFDAIRYSDFTQTFSVVSSDKSLIPMKKIFTKVLEEFNKTRAEKEAQHRYFETVVQHVGVGLLIFKSDGQIDLINRAARKLFGISNIKHLDALRKIKRSLPDSLIRIQPGEKSHIQIQHPESGDLLTLSIYTTRFIIQEEIFTLASIQNIQSELEEKELEAWQNLIRVLTHEIMNSITPIASLASTVKNLLDNIFKDHKRSDTIEDVDQAVKTIETRSHGLLKFVQSYRQLTRLPKPEFKIVPILPMIEHIEQLMQPRFKEKQVALNTSVHPSSLEITADPTLIEQVLINLMQNALDWCSRKPQGKVTLQSEMGKGGHPIIQVIDNGPGIQKEALDKIFIPFFTTKEDGTGIGLSLSRQIMRLHKGNINVQSTPDQETIFTLRF